MNVISQVRGSVHILDVSGPQFTHIIVEAPNLISSYISFYDINHNLEFRRLVKWLRYVHIHV